MVQLPPMVTTAVIYRLRYFLLRLVHHPLLYNPVPTHIPLRVPLTPTNLFVNFRSINMIRKGSSKRKTFPRKENSHLPYGTSNTVISDCVMESSFLPMNHYVVTISWACTSPRYHPTSRTSRNLCLEISLPASTVTMYLPINRSLMKLDLVNVDIMLCTIFSVTFILFSWIVHQPIVFLLVSPLTLLAHTSICGNIFSFKKKLAIDHGTLAISRTKSFKACLTTLFLGHE